jgi:transposase
MSANTCAHATIPASLTAKLLLPEADYLRLDEIVIDGQDVTITTTSCQTTPCCPSCGVVATREHSRYVRRPGDLPCVGRQVRLQLNVRRFFCDNPACQQRTFVERLPGVVRSFARRTTRLADIQRQIGLALGGEAGARSAMRQAMPVSADTLLRLADQSEFAPAATPKVLGVDDWAWKKGQTYGTILVDLEQHCVIDLLTDRSADTLATWLQAHPGVEVISRDRGGSYAEGARRGAPDAVQVADRWHLLANLREALQRLLTRKHTALPSMPHADDRVPQPAAAPAVLDTAAVEELATTVLVATTTADLGQGDATQVASEPSVVAATKDQLLRQQRRARRLSRYAEVMRFHEQGVSVRQIAQHMGMGRQTVRRYLNHGVFPEIVQRRKLPSILDRWEPYLLERWQAGCHNALQLYREIHEQGYTGSRPLLSRWAAQRRKAHAAAPSGVSDTVPEPLSTQHQPAMRRLSPSQAAWLLVQQPADLNEDEQKALDQLQQAVAEIAAAYTLAQDFVRMVRERTVDALADWLARAAASCVAELGSFANGLQRDLAAVTAGLSLPWSNGQVEGQINRLKLIKRTMYGRASFDLLRKRVLAPT